MIELLSVLFHISVYLGLGAVALILGLNIFHYAIKAIATIGAGFVEVLAKVFG
jgi:hypothetical protein